MTAVAIAQRKPKITLPANIIAALDDPAWWQPWFVRGDWQPWRSFGSAAFGLPMDDAALQIYRECTGRSEPPQHQVTEAWAICGRRAGKRRASCRPSARGLDALSIGGNTLPRENAARSCCWRPIGVKPGPPCATCAA
jgi:hypothetical protein